MTELRFAFPEGVSGHALAAILAEEYALRMDEPVETKLIFYDTFDWRLYNKSLTLHRAGKEWTIRRLPSGEILKKLITRPAPATSEEGGIKTASTLIGSVVGERRLLMVGAARVQTTHFRVLNADEKTIAHLSVDVFFAPEQGEPSETVVTLLPVRGYLRHFRRLVVLLDAAGLTASRWQESFEQIVAATGKPPGAYSARPDYQLRPDMRSDEAARLIHRQTLDVMRANEEGIKADWDIEFLHDFRTAVRRTRSALSQIPGVFDPHTTEYYKEAFGAIGERTNRLRDIDVYLPSEADYRAMLPGAMAEQITPFFDFLRSQRQQALTEVTTYLNSPEYAELVSGWKAFLNQAPSDALNAALPIQDFARRQIRKRYRRVIEDGSQIREHTEDAMLHALRIDCKKLRYLIEFFSSLFPKEEIEKLVGQMKTLQDELGAYNDLSVQQIYLMQIADSLPVADAQGKRALVAIGFLVEKLAAEQQAMKPKIVKRFADFAAPNNRALFRQLFKQDDRIATA